MKEIGRVVLEALVVVVVGLVFAFVANFISKQGLVMSKDYLVLPKKLGGPVHTQPGTNGHVPTTTQATTSATTPSTDPSVESEKLIKDAGFTAIKYDEVLQMYNDPKYQNDLLYIFVDARSEEQYKTGHIPWAWRLDHVHPEQAIDVVLPLVQSAEKVVLYCHGGNCDDSLRTAGYLRDQHAIDVAKMRIYVGGFEEWAAKKQPVEKGERMSGDITAGGAK
jgi:rhodanese-related sulfurtransferase